MQEPPSPHLDTPCLRRGLDIFQDERDPRSVFLRDRCNLNPRPQRLTLLEFACLQLFDGARTLRDIQAEAIRMVGGQLLPWELFTGLAEKLDAGLFLEGIRFREKLAEPMRAPACLSSYGRDPNPLRRSLDRLFTGPGGPGLPRPTAPDGTLRAALVPHIDYPRGGVTYAWGFKELFERSDASLFVIIGTSHYSPERFTLTRKDFQTPLGVAKTDQAYIDRLVLHYGDGLFDDELAHLPEHAIELEVVFLQYLYEGRRPFRIVPLVVGSFQDAVQTGVPPRAHADVARMMEALRQVEEETNEPICYVISGDLAHIGPKFGDREPVAEPVLGRSRAQDLALMRHAEAADAGGYFRVIADERDGRRICGLPPTYTVLEAVRPRRGRLLHYDQYVHPRGHESVSFASVAFYR